MGITPFRLDHEDGSFTSGVLVDVDAAPGAAHGYSALGYDDHRDDYLVNRAAHFSAFGAQAPDHRSLLFHVPPAESDAAEVYGAAHVRLGDLRFLDCGSYERQVLRLLLADGGLVSAGGGLRLHGDIPAALGCRAEAVLDRCQAERRLLFYPSGKQDMRTLRELPGSINLFVPLSRHGALLSRVRGADIWINGGFFISSEEEWADDPFAQLMDPVGLAVSEGRMWSPPLYRRPALVMRRGPCFSIDTVDMADVAVRLNGREVAPERIRTRASAPAPPPDYGAIVSGTRVVAVAGPSCDKTPPMNGYLIAASSDDDVGDRPVLDATLTDPSIEAACQGWARVVSDGVLVDPSADVDNYSFAPIESGATDQYPPLHLHRKYLFDTTHRPNTVVGVRDDGSAVFVVVAGTEPRSYDPSVDSRGESIATLGRMLISAGCTQALALDGGGSSVVSEDGRLHIRPADRFDFRYVATERPIPSGWRISRPRPSGRAGEERRTS